MIRIKDGSKEKQKIEFVMTDTPSRGPGVEVVAKATTLLLLFVFVRGLFCWCCLNWVVDGGNAQPDGTEQ